MTTLSATDARRQFDEIIAESIVNAQGLKESLEDERQALEKQDMGAMQVAVDNKSVYVKTLQDLDLRREELCQSLGFQTGAGQMSQLIEWCDDGDLINNRWQQLMVIAADSRALNMTNGAIIRVRQQQIESSLSLIRGTAPGSDTYGHNGAEFGDYGSRSLAEA